MAKTQSPLLGYNTNVRHKGKVFHIQTEDSGVAKPHVITHLFADGGRIIKSVKTSYADRLESADLQTQVKKLMQDQHKAMFIALRDGVYDDQMEVTARTPSLADTLPTTTNTNDLKAAAAPSATASPSPTAEAAPVEADDLIELDESSFVDEAPASAPTPPTPIPAAPPPLQPAATMTAPRANPRQSQGWPAAPTRTSPPLGAAPSGPPPLRPPPQRATTTAPLGQPTLAAASSAPVASPTPAPAGPVARPDKRTPAPAPRVGAVFGERLVSERSLDEVILAYLAEEVGEKPRR